MRVAKLSEYFHLSLQQLFKFIIASESAASDGFDGYCLFGLSICAFVYFSELTLSDQIGNSVLMLCAFDGSAGLLHLNLTTPKPNKQVK
jgi:hypothetical protein